jgi:hypothetical protein
MESLHVQRLIEICLASSLYEFGETNQHNARKPHEAVILAIVAIACSQHTTVAGCGASKAVWCRCLPQGAEIDRMSHSNCVAWNEWSSFSIGRLLPHARQNVKRRCPAVFSLYIAAG